MHPSCLKAPAELVQEIQDVTTYPVPTKPGEASLSRAVTWHHYSGGAETQLERLKAAAPSGAQLKYDNAIAFVRATPLT